MDYQGTKIDGANMQERRKAQTQRLVLQPLSLLTKLLYSVVAERPDKAFSKAAQLGGKLGVHDRPITVSLANTSFFWLES